MAPRTSKGPSQWDIPANAIFIDFPCSDGNASSCPTNTVRRVDAAGEVNFMEFLDVDKPLPRKWRDVVGSAIGKEFKLGDGRFFLRDWPQHYRMYDHHKGPQHNPRHDIYLFGGPSRFRSPNEFVPHAIWLYGNRTGTCICKYCTKRPQKQITESLAAILPAGLTKLTPTFYRVKAAPAEKTKLKELNIYAAIQQNNSAKISKDVLEKHPMLAERNQDLRAVHVPSSLRLKRWCRTGELVWCALSEPIRGYNGLEDAIFLWPGLVDEYKLRSNPIPVPNPGEDEAPWTVEQSIEYKVKLLAIEVTLTGRDIQVIPYQAFTPSLELVNTLVKIPPSQLKVTHEYLSTFQFRDDGVPPDKPLAYSAYALAIQIASLASTYWSLTDQYEFKCTIPPNHSPFTPETTVNSNHPGQGTGMPSGSNPYMELRKLPGQVPGNHPAGYLVSMTKFQGLWWGSERVWIGDIVRIKLPREGFVPKGGPNVLPPSGPGKMKREEAMRAGDSLEDIGAGSRGLFMRLDSLFLVEVSPKDGKLTKECRASGMIYELADADWEPDTPEATANPPAHFASTWTDMYPLPESPAGYKFRPILQDGYECVLSIALISGRYYSGILSHPLLGPCVSEALQTGGLLDNASLWSLEGLTPGYSNAMDPTVYKTNRLKMFEDADSYARKELEEYTASRPAEVVTAEGSMDVSS